MIRHYYCTIMCYTMTLWCLRHQDFFTPLWSYGTTSYMWSVVDQNIIVWHYPIFQMPRIFKKKLSKDLISTCCITKTKEGKLQEICGWLSNIYEQSIKIWISFWISLGFLKKENKDDEDKKGKWKIIWKMMKLKKEEEEQQQ